MNKNLKKIIKRLLELSFKDGKMIESQITKSIKILKSLPKSQTIRALSEYVKELKVRQRQHTMYVETVIPLSSSQIERIKKIVEKKVNITKVVTSINPGILGGFKLRIGDEVWDETIVGKVSQLKEAIISGRSN